MNTIIESIPKEKLDVISNILRDYRGEGNYLFFQYKPENFFSLRVNIELKILHGWLWDEDYNHTWEGKRISFEEFIDMEGKNTIIQYNNGVKKIISL
jgi:hypothetical protein